MKVDIIFDVLHLYYLPQYLPVFKKLAEQQINCSFVFYRNNDAVLQQVTESTIASEGLNVHWVDSWTGALEYYLEQAAKWVVFGNAVDDIGQIKKVSKTAMMLHGIGPKAVYYDMPKEPMDVRFVEGQYRLNRLQSMYPNDVFIDTGYAKLDPALNSVGENLKLENLSLESLGLDSNKPTILYAPTFYPSSIERMPSNLPQVFARYNVIVKPHFFSLTKTKYKKQRQILESWNKQDNVYLCNVADYNLVPFMQVSDVMLSDASSAIFEFAALDKPVVWCDFYQLRWSYRGIFSFRFKKRVDSDIGYFEQVGYRIESSDNLLESVEKSLLESSDKVLQRQKVIQQLAGRVDGQSSARVVEYLIKN